MTSGFMERLAEGPLLVEGAAVPGQLRRRVRWGCWTTRRGVLELHREFEAMTWGCGRWSGRRSCTTQR